jgi:glycosyltransferase involved in cell wall biosynthesis
MTRVLMTADAVGGVWRYAVDLGSALRERGARSTLAVMGPPPDARQRQEARHAGLDVLDRPYRLEWMDDPWNDVALAGEWLLGLERTLAPDVVHLNGYVHAALPWSAPTVVVAHSCVRTWWRAVRAEAPPSSVDQYTAAVRGGLAAACEVVAPTASMLAAIEDEYGRPRRTHVIPNGRRQSSPAAAHVRTSKEHLVLAAGRVWDEAKNIAALCGIASQLPWPVYVAGSCERPDGTHCDLPGVRLLGHLPTAELSRWYRRASIYALPARYEPFGLSVLEAAAAGCALVLGDIDTLRENWADAATFVPPDDAPALAEAIQRLIDWPRLRIEMARRASARASLFTIDRMADEYTCTYRRLTA